MLKKLEQRNYADEIEDATISQMKIANSITDQEEDCKKLKAKKRRIKREITTTKQKIDSIPKEIIDIGNLMSLIEKKESGPNFPAIRRFTFFLVWYCHRRQSEGFYTELRSLRMQRILGGRLTPSLSQVLGTQSRSSRTRLGLHECMKN